MNKLLKRMQEMYETARIVVECTFYDDVVVIVPGEPKILDFYRTLGLSVDENRESCPLAARLEQVKKPDAPSDEELDKLVEAKVEFYKRNVQAFVDDYKKVSMNSISLRPFTEQEILTHNILAITTYITHPFRSVTVDYIHHALTKYLEVDYDHSRARTYRALERGVALGLLSKSKVKGRVDLLQKVISLN